MKATVDHPTDVLSTHGSRARTTMLPLLMWCMLVMVGCIDEGQAICEVGAVRCVQNELQQCTTNLEYDVLEVCDVGCEAGRCACDGFAPECDGDEVTQCQAGVVTSAICSNGCQDGQCVECDPGDHECELPVATLPCEGTQTRCDGDLLLRCTDGTFVEEAACEYGCDEGACTEPDCEEICQGACTAEGTCVQCEALTEFAPASDAYNLLSADLPVVWSDRRDTGWFTHNFALVESPLGPAINASTNVQAWFTDDTVPGLFVGASRALALAFTPAEVVSAYVHDGCTSAITDAQLSVAGYEGYRRVMSCPAGHRWDEVALWPAERDYIVSLQARLVTPCDDSAMDRALDSLQVSTLPAVFPPSVAVFAGTYVGGSNASNAQHSLMFELLADGTLQGTSTWPVTGEFTLVGSVNEAGLVSIQDDAPERITGFKRGLYTGTVNLDNGTITGTYADSGDPTLPIAPWSASR